MHSGKRYPIYVIVLIYVLLVLAGNFVGDTSLKAFHFVYSSGTLFFQLVFCGTIFLTELIGFNRTAKIVWLCGFLHLMVGLIVYVLLGFSFPDYWLKQDLVVPRDHWQYLNMAFMFSIGYLCSAFAMINVAGVLRAKLGQKWMFLRITLVTLTGILFDMLTLCPIILFISPDSYMKLWKVISLVSVKLILSLFTIPMTYLSIFLFKKWLRYGVGTSFPLSTNES